MHPVFKRLTILLAAAFALSALTASAALAQPEYLIKYSGILHAKVTETLPVLLTGHYEVVDNEEGGLRPYGASCTIENKEAKIKPAGAGEIITFTSLSGCEGTHECPRLLHEWEATNMPLTTELFTEGTETRNKTFNKSGKKPGFYFACGTKVHECSFPTSMHIKNGKAEVEGKSQDVVENEFDTKGGSITCTGGTGEWKGILKIALTKADREKYTTPEGIEAT
jgi:hypothetical protein